MNPIHVLIAGLGNPSPYQLTRHSVGNILIDSLASRLGVTLANGRYGQMADAWCDVGKLPARVTLYKSKSYMNISGPPLVRVLKDLNLAPSHLIVAHDSLYHKVKTISPKGGGSANGHNGIRSVIAALGGDAFPRLRLGIGKNDYDAATYVLEKMSPEELHYWGANGNGAGDAWKNIEHIVHRLQNSSRV